jgi:hypothetical protein
MEKKCIIVYLFLGSNRDVEEVLFLFWTDRLKMYSQAKGGGVYGDIIVCCIQQQMNINTPNQQPVRTVSINGYIRNTSARAQVIFRRLRLYK